MMISSEAAGNAPVRAELRLMKEEIERRTGYERILLKSASILVGTRYDLMEPVVTEILGEIGGFAGANRAYIMRFDFAGAVKSMVNEWCAPGVDPVRRDLQGIPLRSGYPALIDSILAGHEIYVEDIADLPDGWSAEKAHWAAHDVVKVFAVPMMHGARCLGFLGINSPSGTRTWPDGSRQLLKVLADTIASMWIRAGQDESLQAASVHATEIARRAESASRAKDALLAEIIHDSRQAIDEIIAQTYRLPESGPALTIRRHAGDILAMMERYLDYAQTDRRTVPGNRESTGSIVARLRHCLENQEPGECLDLADTLQRRCLPGEMERAVAGIMDAVAEFRFADALKALDLLSPLQEDEPKEYG